MGLRDRFSERAGKWNDNWCLEMLVSFMLLLWELLKCALMMDIVKWKDPSENGRLRFSYDPGQMGPCDQDKEEYMDTYQP